MNQQQSGSGEVWVALERVLLAFRFFWWQLKGCTNTGIGLISIAMFGLFTTEMQHARGHRLDRKGFPSHWNWGIRVYIGKMIKSGDVSLLCRIRVFMNTHLCWVIEFELIKPGIVWFSR